MSLCWAESMPVSIAHKFLYDKKALELKNRLPLDLIEQNMQNQYTFWPLLPGLLIWIGLFGLFWNADRTV